MWNDILTRWLRWLGGSPCLRIYGKARVESNWRVIDVYAMHRRDAGGRLPLWRGTCTTWTDRVIAVGWDFAERLLREQRAMPASRQHPVAVAGGRTRDRRRRAEAGAAEFPSASEVLAHECGHTWQALRLGAAYLPLVGSVTLFREGAHLWNHFENQASEQGQFGGLVNGSVCAELSVTGQHLEPVCRYQPEAPARERSPAARAGASGWYPGFGPIVLNSRLGAIEASACPRRG